MGVFVFSVLAMARGEKYPEIAGTFCESCQPFKVELNRSYLGWRIGGRIPQNTVRYASTEL